MTVFVKEIDHIPISHVVQMKTYYTYPCVKLVNIYDAILEYAQMVSAIFSKHHNHFLACERVCETVIYGRTYVTAQNLIVITIMSNYNKMLINIYVFAFLKLDFDIYFSP